MSDLQRFVPSEQELLVSLFYRVGHWLSNVDDTDLDDASENMENAQLERILRSLSKSKNVPPLCAALSAAALDRQDSWSRWSSMDDTIAEDIQAGCRIIKGQGTKAEYDGFSNCLMTISTAVARAFREEPEMQLEEENFLDWLSEKTSQVSLAVKDWDAFKDLNVSPAEDTALHELWAILRA